MGGGGVADPQTNYEAKAKSVFFPKVSMYMAHADGSGSRGGVLG